jgi:hypothetical protein
LNPIVDAPTGPNAGTTIPRLVYQDMFGRTPWTLGGWMVSTSRGLAINADL